MALMHKHYRLDTRADRPLRISAYMHCAMCLAERPADVSPRDWARLSVGFGPDNELQVWCVRHDVNVALVQPNETGRPQ